MNLENRLRALEEKTKPANPEPRQTVLMVTPDSPQWDEVMLALIGCGAVTVHPCQDAQDGPQSA
jgi:hypothetical protein